MLSVVHAVRKRGGRRIDEAVGSATSRGSSTAGWGPFFHDKLSCTVVVVVVAAAAH